MFDICTVQRRKLYDLTMRILLSLSNHNPFFRIGHRMNLFISDYVLDMCVYILCIKIVYSMCMGKKYMRISWIW